MGAMTFNLPHVPCTKFQVDQILPHKTWSDESYLLAKKQRMKTVSLYIPQSPLRAWHTWQRSDQSLPLKGCTHSQPLHPEDPAPSKRASRGPSNLEIDLTDDPAIPLLEIAMTQRLFLGAWVFRLRSKYARLWQCSMMEPQKTVIWTPVLGSRL